MQRKPANHNSRRDHRQFEISKPAMIRFLAFYYFQVCFKAPRIFSAWVGQSIPPAAGVSVHIGRTTM